jgi:hypothetical protein
MVEESERDEDKLGEFAGWVLPWIERVYARLGPRGWDEDYPVKTLEEVQAEVENRVKRARAEREEGKDKEPEQGRGEGDDDFNDERRVLSFFEPGIGRNAIAKVSYDYWVEKCRQFADRIARLKLKGKFPDILDSRDLPQAGVPGANNWVPVGPSVVLKGQASGNPPVGGRTTGIAVAPGGIRCYAASADGGLWRSDDGGANWNPTMDGFDLNPISFGTTSNACGAVAIDPASPDRVYVGTGEADTWAMWARRITTGLPSYRGVGAIRSDDGGATWISEPVRAGDPTLNGEGFFQLAVDPANRENVVAATTAGLYQRESDGAGGWQWSQRVAGAHSSVVVCQSGTPAITTFYAAALNGGVITSTDGMNWSAAGTGFPVATRVSLGARPSDPTVLYAYNATAAGFDLWRLDGGAGAWQQVTGLPNLGSQQNFNLPVAVDPTDATTIYIAGSGIVSGGEWTAPIYRCSVSPTAGGGFSMTPTFIGGGVHADVHSLVVRSDLATELWTGTDGGIFRTTNATGAGTFVHRNTGYSTLCTNFIAQHPTELAVMLSGLQDNGTARYTGEEAWLHVTDGDGGYPIIDWANPRNMMSYANGSVRIAADGAQSKASFTTLLSPPWVIMAEPIKTTPYNPASPGDSQTVAFGAGTDLYITTDFGANWPTIDTLTQNIFALAFASPNILYVGTTGGRVFRYVLAAGAWTPTRLDNVAAGPLGVAGLLTDIEVDPANNNNIWVTFGGTGELRHIWYFDGTQWNNVSGPSQGHANAVLDVSHNAIVADPATLGRLYVAADIGVWTSSDSGANWTPMSNGLPDAAVMDLQLHPTLNILRAGTHGRGVFEYKIDAPAQADVDVYVRDTSLDMARFPTVNWLADPETWPNVPVRHYKSRNIKIDPQSPTGFQTPTTSIDFVTFNDVIVDQSDGVVSEDPAVGTVTNRVYVEVHNRGIVPAVDARVMLLLANSSAGLPDLPSGYETNVIAGTNISTASWQTVGFRSALDLRNHLPQVLEFDLPSTMLPPPASLPGQSHHCILALSHSSQDPFSETYRWLPFPVRLRRDPRRSYGRDSTSGAPCARTGSRFLLSTSLTSRGRCGLCCHPSWRNKLISAGLGRWNV